MVTGNESKDIGNKFTLVGSGERLNLVVHFDLGQKFANQFARSSASFNLSKAEVESLAKELKEWLSSAGGS